MSAGTFDVSCPLPSGDEGMVLAAHGGGGLAMQRLIRSILLPAFGNGEAVLHDSATLAAGGARLAFTTDSSVVSPRRFPGGDIGRLSVFGTINDLAMAGARPLALSCALILEEGMPLDELKEIVTSMGRAAAEVGVPIVTGDTKTVERGKGDGVFINSSGVGLIEHGLDVHPRSIRPGDALLVSGDIARHGTAIALARHDPDHESGITSDLSCLWPAVQALLSAGITLHCLRDLTRGGLAAALCELADSAGLAFEVRESDIPVSDSVTAATEVLGFDPLQLACEGRMLVVVPEQEADAALKTLRKHAPGGNFARGIGSARAGEDGLVTMESVIGTRRILDLPAGEALPRIC